MSMRALSRCKKFSERVLDALVVTDRYEEVGT